MHVKLGAWSIALALCLTAGVCLGASAVQWQPSLERAQILAAHSNRLVLVHFWGDGCPPCEWMEREVFSRPDVAQAIDRGFVAVKINRDQSPGVAGQFGVAAVPTDVVITPQGQVLGSHMGATSAPEFVDRLNQTAQRGLPPTGPNYVGETWAIPAQTAYSQQGSQVQPQPNAAYVPGASANRISQSGSPFPQQSPAVNQALAAQTIPQYSGQYGMGPNSSPGYDTNPPAAATARQPGFSPQPPDQQLAAAPTTGNPPFALEGFCAVSLERTMRLDPQPRWVPGDPRWGLRHEGRTYLFAGPEEQQAFFDNPNFYAPVLSGYDAVLQIEQGQQVPGVREFGARWRDRVYLFSSRESFEKFQSNPGFYENRILGPQQAVAGPARSSAQNVGAAMNPAHGYR